MKAEIIENLLPEIASMNLIVVVDLHAHRVLIIPDEGETPLLDALAKQVNQVLQSYTRAVDAETERLKLS